MRHRLIRKISVAASIVLAGTLAFAAVRDAVLTANAEETLPGIQTLILEVAEREKAYRILEIVPDEAAAEIGYYIEGSEPILSERQDDGTYLSWQERMGEFQTAGERAAFVEELSVKLQDFYKLRGFEGENVPVSYTPYEESEVPGEGYTEFSFDGEVKRGYFQSARGDATERYRLRFLYAGNYADHDLIAGMTSQLYAVTAAAPVTAGGSYADSTELYLAEGEGSGRHFKYAGTWGELKSSVSSGDTAPTVSGGNGQTVSGSDGSNPITGGGTVYYVLTMQRFTKDMVPAVDSSLYAVESVVPDVNGPYGFVETPDGGFEVSFASRTIYYKGGFVNNEWFRRNVVNLEDVRMEDFPVEVMTLTPAELNALDGQNALPEYDLLYLNSGFGKNAGGLSYGADNDLSESVRGRLFERTMANALPCIVDASVLFAQGNGGEDFLVNEALRNTKLFSLCAMLSQKSPLQFYNEHGNGGGVSVQELLDGMVEDQDKNFVTEQVYSFFAPSALVSADFTQPVYYKNGEGTGQEEGFLAVLDEILSENLNREADASGQYQPLATDVSQAAAVRHILNYQNRRQIELKDEIRILELEPCLSEEDSYDLTEEEVKTWALGVSAAKQDLKVTIDRMTTAEFIGRIENINEKYDLVYIGTDRDHLNVDSEGNTVFNDASMNGLIYFHTGDLRYGSMELAGQLNTEYVDGDRGKPVYYYNPVRYGGNDITAEKRDALLGFLDASYPVIVSDEFFVKETDGSGRTLDETHVDNSSYLYEFLKAGMERENFYSRSEIGPDSAMFRFYLNRPKAELTGFMASGTPGENGVYNLYQGSDGNYLLEYKFVIENKGAASADTRYQCKLFVDVNSDGKFSAEEELKDIYLLENGSGVSADRLYAGREYVLRRNVPHGYKGLLPWKVQISQVNNANIKCSAVGYTKLKGLERETLEILQISRDERILENGGKETLFNLEERINDPGDIYHVLMYGGTYNGVYYNGIYDDFDVNATFMTISEFEEAFGENSDLLNEYNMLILGFADAYGNLSGTNDSGPLGAIVKYIQSGKSVLLTHDTVSCLNYDTDKAGVVNRATGQTRTVDQRYNSYSLSKYIRSLVGMDRYGVTEYEQLKSGAELNETSDFWGALLQTGKEIAFVPGSGRSRAYGLTQGYTYSAVNAKDLNQEISHDSAHPIGSHEAFAPAQTGLGQNFTNTYLNLNFGTVYYHDNLSDDGEIPANYTGEVSNLWVTQVNRGQITEYPYRLEEELQVSPTHGQYYQLDFTADDDEDGQSDLVVWYCLGDRGSKDQRQDTIYSLSPNDVANNYYIYNRGNITYTGMGHAGNTSTVDEAKLFINTLIAAYSAGVKDPDIVVLSGGTEKAREITSVNRYYDESNDLHFQDPAEGPVDERYEKVFFQVNDPNFVKGSRRIAVNCYYESKDADAPVEFTYEGRPVKVRPVETAIYRASTGEEADRNNLVSGERYYILIDKAVMGDYGGRFSVYFEAQSTIKSESSTLVTGKVYRKFEFVRVQMFDLE